MQRCLQRSLSCHELGYRSARCYVASSSWLGTTFRLGTATERPIIRLVLLGKLCGTQARNTMNTRIGSGVYP